VQVELLSQEPSAVPCEEPLASPPFIIATQVPEVIFSAVPKSRSLFFEIV